jgi:CheY-like chemotaxis protein
VESDPDTRELYSLMLADVAHDIQLADDGRIALAKVVAQRPDLVVTETRVPFIDGYMLCQLLRADPSTATVPIIVATADAIHRRPPGADAVLVKPFSVTQFIDAIRVVLDATSSSIDGRRARNSCLPVEVADRASGRRERMMSHVYQRYATTMPPQVPPSPRCPRCDLVLTYIHSQIGGVSARSPEQWDLFECPRRCGSFEYRHRTKRLRLILS